jgi:Lon protease-like protein
MAVADLPLFPLRTVLFPEGLLELKIFETRYLDLISRCLREHEAFGVVALKSGHEARHAHERVELHEVGTIAELIDVDSAQVGILQVRCRGGARFAVGATHQEKDGLWRAATTPIGADPVVAPASAHGDIVRGLAEAIAALAAQDTRPFLEPHRLDDAGWVANRWCEILPFPLEAKQRLMALEDPLARLDVVDSLLRIRDETH